MPQNNLYGKLELTIIIKLEKVSSSLWNNQTTQPYETDFFECDAAFQEMLVEEDPGH